MENRKNIQDELREISPVVAGISLQNPYTVPAGYFEGLAEQVLQLVQADEEPVVTVFAGIKDPYTVPQGYFEGLPAQLLNRVQANDEQLPAALQQAKANPYRVPQDYFDNLPATILNLIKAGSAENADEELEILSPLLKQIGKKTPFSTPAGFFNELPGNARSIDFVNGAPETLSPLMTGLKQKQAYEVPAGYFEQLPARVLQAVQQQQPAKRVSMRFTRRIFRYAAAAAVAGALVVAGWMYLGKTTKTVTGIPPAVAANLEKISDETLENYIENQTILPAEPAVPTSHSEIDQNDMKEMLADVSDEDLRQYLEKYNTSKDILTN